MYSKTVIVGNLARDPESRKAGETNVTRLVVAVNDARQKDKVSYIDVDAWSEELIKLIQDESTLVDMGERARQRGVPDAAQRIVSDLRDLASVSSEVMS